MTIVSLAYKIRRVVKLGFRSIIEHKLRSFLTALGIIFGVGSVIAMLAIGEGASFEAREQIRTLGSSNIIIRSVKPPSTGGIQRGALVTYGLTYNDVMRIKDLYPDIQIHIPAREINMRLRYERQMVPGKVIGTVPWALATSSMTILQGRFFNAYDIGSNANAVVLSQSAAQKLFLYEYPIGKNIYLGKQAYYVIGVIGENGTPAASDKKLKSDNKERSTSKNKHQTGKERERYDVYIPITAASRRFGEIIMINDTGSRTMEKVELHQLTVTAPTENSVMPISEAIRATLRQTHRNADYEIVVPLELLKQAEQTKRIFNIVLGSIAAISLLVGGIGIMNIMLASVTERTREIGIRRALGARRGDIVLQFLTESLLLSLFGGFIGVALGIAVPKLVTHLAGLITIIQLDAIILAFSISMFTGIIFGIYPAFRAAALSPIEALRHE